MKKAKKIILNVLKIVLLLLLLIVVGGFVIVQLMPGITDRAKNTSVAGSECWMAAIPDDTLLSDISIPGAHDFGSRNVQLALFSKCQSRTATQLLQDGFRYLDIRLGVEYVGDEPVMTLYHGFTHCLSGHSIFSGHLTLDEVLEDCREFLTQNPTETILFVVKKEHGDESFEDFEKVLTTYTDDSFLLTDTIPTLGEARGKIVLFRRYADYAGLGKDSGIYLNWSQQKANDDVSLTYEAYNEAGFTAYVQDRYKYGAEDKWKAFEATVAETDGLLEKGLVINFLSTNGTPAFGHPYKYAKTLNKLLLEQDFSSKRLGWVIVDFGNAEIAEKIYSKN